MAETHLSRRESCGGHGIYVTLDLVPPRPRDMAPGIHHVWVHATGSERYFVDNIDRIGWIRLLVRALDVHGWTCLAFCQMSTHVHLMLSVPDMSLPLGMKQLNMAYSRDFNAQHQRLGQFVRRRYGSRRVADSRDLLGTYAYVVLNPVTAGVVPRPEDWRWSSHATALGISRDFPFVDTSVVVAEAGSIEELRGLVDARGVALLMAQRATSGV
jgi:REP element-mobilizing transposase RayT